MKPSATRRRSTTAPAGALSALSGRHRSSRDSAAAPHFNAPGHSSERGLVGEVWAWAPLCSTSTSLAGSTDRDLDVGVFGVLCRRSPGSGGCRDAKQPRSNPKAPPGQTRKCSCSCLSHLVEPLFLPAELEVRDRALEGLIGDHERSSSPDREGRVRRRERLPVAVVGRAVVNSAVAADSP